MARNEKITPGQLLLPLSLIGCTVFFLLGFQTTQIIRDREALQQSRAAQDKPLEDANKVQAQVEALALGTKKLAEKGDKDAQAIIEKLMQMGISVGAPPPNAPPPAGMAPPSAPAAPPAPPQQP